jgi:hypothetical protein
MCSARPGDELLAVAGKPYDTLEEVIGLRGTPGHGSLREWGVTYRELDLAPGGAIDWHALSSAITPSARTHPLLPAPYQYPPEGNNSPDATCFTSRHGCSVRCTALHAYVRDSESVACPGTRVALIQRSCGYALRPTLAIADVARAVELVKAQSARCSVFVDNCYGEFTEEREPCSVRAPSALSRVKKPPCKSCVLDEGGLRTVHASTCGSAFYLTSTCLPACMQRIRQAEERIDLRSLDPAGGRGPGDGEPDQEPWGDHRAGRGLHRGAHGDGGCCSSAPDCPRRWLRRRLRAWRHAAAHGAGCASLLHPCSKVLLRG